MIVLSSGTVIILYMKKWLCFNTKKNYYEMSGLENEAIQDDEDNNYDN